MDDDDQRIVIVGYLNHHIIERKMRENNGKVIADGRGKRNRSDQLNYPIDVLIDKETDSLLITDQGNRQGLRCS